MVAKRLHSADVIPSNKYRISSYIYFNYYNWMSSGAIQTFDTNLTAGNIKAYCDQVLAQEKQKFAGLVGMKYDDFMNGLAENAKLIQNFNVLFTGGITSKDTLPKNSSGMYSSIKTSSEDIVNFLHNGKSLTPEEQTLIFSFLENFGDISANQYYLIQKMKEKGTVEILNNLCNGSYRIDVNSDEYFLKIALSDLYEQLNSSTSFAQIGGSKFNNEAVEKILKQTQFVATKQMQENIQKNVDSLGLVLNKIKNHQKISPEEISGPLSKLQSAYGAQSESVGAIEQKIVMSIGEKIGQEAGKAAAKESLSKMFSGITNTGTKQRQITAILDSKIGTLDGEKLANVVINKTADITVKMKNGKEIAISQKRYNPITSYSLHITSRSLSNLLNYAATVDPVLINQLENPMLLNALYFAYGKKSYDYSRDSNGSLIYPLKIVSTSPGNLGRVKIDQENNLLLSKFALRLLIGTLSSVNQALLEVNGLLIPMPAYLELVFKNIIATFGSGEDSTIFRDVQFNVSNFSKELSGAILPERKRPGKHEKFNEANEEHAIKRNQSAKQAIQNHMITVRTPFITVEQYRSLLSNSSTK